MSIKISLNSLMKGGKTIITEIRKINDKEIITIKRDNGLGILNKYLIWLHRLQIILDITREHIMRRKKSLRLQKIKKKITSANILKRNWLFNLFNIVIFQSILNH